MRNRSVPVDTLLPHLNYANLAEAIDWLSRTFGFQEHFRYGEPVAGAQLHLGPRVDHGGIRRDRAHKSRGGWAAGRKC